MSKREDNAVIQNMKEAIDRIVSYTSKMTYDDFLQDYKTQDANLTSNSHYLPPFDLLIFDRNRAIFMWSELGYGNFSLHFIKNKEKEEVDFLIAKDYEPVLLVEIKSKDKAISRSLQKFHHY